MVFENFKDFTTQDLVSLLQSNGIREGALKIIEEEAIAGRHLVKLAKIEDLKQFGLKAGDLYDIQDVLEEHEKKLSKPDKEGFGDRDLQNNLNIFIDDKRETNDDGNKENSVYDGLCRKIRSATKTSESSDEIPVSSINVFEDAEFNDDGDELDMGLISSVNLDMYLPEDVIEDMSPAEKQAASRKIENWLFLMKNKINAPFPTIHEMVMVSKPLKKTSMEPKEKSTKTIPDAVRRSERVSSLVTSASDKESSRRPLEPIDHSSNSMVVDGTSSSMTQKRHHSLPLPPPLKKVATESAQPTTTESEIPLHLTPFLKAASLDKREKALIKNALLNVAIHKYEIIPALQGKRGMDKILAHLEKGGCIFNKNLSDVCDELLMHISKKPLNILAVNPDMREGLAVCIVATFPQLSQPVVRDGDMPWTWLYDRSNNTGKLAAVYRKHQQKQPQRPRGGGTGRRKMKMPTSGSVCQAAPITFDDLTLSKNTKLLRVLSPTDSSKEEIVRLMRETFSERKDLVSQDVPVGVLLHTYVHLKSFQGEMIDLDFELWHPGKKNNFLKNFQNMIPQLKEAAKRDDKKYPPDEVFEYGDESLNALVILSKFLPKPKRTQDFEKNMNPLACLDDIFQIVPVGSNIQYEVNSKRNAAKHPIQPYILAVGSKKETNQLYLVWGDGHSMELPRNCFPLRGIDFLIKAHFVLRTPYILGWKYVLRFLQVHAFLIPPDKPRETSFTDKAMELKTFILHENSDDDM